MTRLANAEQMLNIDKVTSFPQQKLRTQAEIMRNWEGSREPVVSICCSTYNHVNYIEDAIRGFLAQQTSFAFEVIIRDDASTDGTTEIVQDYARRYPDIIRPLVNSENHFCAGERAVHVWPSVVNGKYCALCEGDDFWISPVKLQNQFDLLEKYPDAVMSVAKTHYYQQDGDELHYLRTTDVHDEVILGFEEIHRDYFHTSTYLIRSNLFKEIIKKYFIGSSLYGDTALRAILIMHGPFVLLSRVVSVYRITGDGIWSGLNREKQLKLELGTAKKLADILPDFHGKFQRQRVYAFSMALFRLHTKNFQVIKGIKITPLVFWYGLMKVLDYINKN